MDPEPGQHRRREHSARRRAWPRDAGNRQSPAHHRSELGLCWRGPPVPPRQVPMSDLTAGSWRTFVTGSTGSPAQKQRRFAWPATRRGSRSSRRSQWNGLQRDRHTECMGRTALADDTMVWQTTDSGDGFCLQTGPLCTFAQFKAQYPTGRFTAVQVAIGTRVPAVTSYADGVSVTTVEDGTEVTDAFDFDVAAAPTPTPGPHRRLIRRPLPRPQPPADLPNTSTDAPSTPSDGAAVYRARIARPGVGSGSCVCPETPPDPVKAEFAALPQSQWIARRSLFAYSEPVSSGGTTGGDPDQLGNGA